RARKRNRRCSWRGRDDDSAQSILRKGARFSHLDVLRAGPLRLGLREKRPRLSVCIRALDGAAQHGGVRANDRAQADRFEPADLVPVGIASAGGLTAHGTGDRFGFSYCTTDANEILRDEKINTVAILTRHNLHAQQVIAGIEAGKNVFVEKPLCLTSDELDAI